MSFCPRVVCLLCALLQVSPILNLCSLFTSSPCPEHPPTPTHPQPAPFWMSYSSIVRKLIYFPLTLSWRKSKTDSHKMTAIFPDVDKSSLSRTFSFPVWQQCGTWSATCKDLSGVGRGACDSHGLHSPPAAAETTRRTGQSEKHMVICRDVGEPRIHHMEWGKSESGKQIPVY